MKFPILFSVLLFLFAFSLFATVDESAALTVVYFDDDGNLITDSAAIEERSKSLPASGSPWWTNRDPADLVPEPLPGGGWSVRLLDVEPGSSEPGFVRTNGAEKGGPFSTFEIVNTDAPGDGLRDPGPPDPASTAGGNPGSTLGEQRLNAMNAAAAVWADVVHSNVTILVQAAFNPLSCGPMGVTLGSASPISVVADWLAAAGGQIPFISNTWYPVALGNALSNQDLVTNTNDIAANFNSDVDDNPTCAPGFQWYYGLDNNPPPGTFDFFQTAIHEICHGLGFATFVDITTGARFSGMNDVFMNFLRDQDSGENWPAMTNAARLSSASDTGNLVWTGLSVSGAAGFLTSGLNSGNVRMYAPATLNPGSSVSHWDTAAFPNQLMEPFETGDTPIPGLSVQLFRDIGWTITTIPPTPVPTLTPHPVTGLAHWEEYE